MESIRIISEPITSEELKRVAQEIFGDMVKAVVDIEKGTMAIGGELHADEEAVLIENGSAQPNLWGINLYPDLSGEDWLEYDSLINIRPSLGNRTRSIENTNTKERIRAIVGKLVIRKV